MSIIPAPCDLARDGHEPLYSRIFLPSDPTICVHKYWLLAWKFPGDFPEGDIDNIRRLLKKCQVWPNTSFSPELFEWFQKVKLPVFSDSTLAEILSDGEPYLDDILNRRPTE